ncbi:MAG: SIS domain-containing protein, partial [Actinomycetota bacterium]
TSLHAAELGASLIQLSGRQAHAVPAMQFVDFAPLVGPQDGIVVITHTAETAYALSTRAQAFSAGLGPVMITKRGSGFPDAIETVDKETSETYTVSYTTAVLAVALLAKELGAESLDEATLGRVPEAVASAIADPSIDAIVQPERLLVFVGAGPSAVTAREGALKIREASRSLAEGYDAEYLLHGSAVPLDVRDRVVAIFPPDPSGLVEAVANAAGSEHVSVTRLREPADLPHTLAQLPLTVRLQLLALRFAHERSQDPDTVIVGAWNDPATWAIGAP